MKKDESDNNCFWFFHKFSKWHEIEIDMIYCGSPAIKKGQRRVCSRCGYIQEEFL
jgi:hypothetical protein